MIDELDTAERSSSHANRSHGFEIFKIAIAIGERALRVLKHNKSP